MKSVILLKNIIRLAITMVRAASLVLIALILVGLFSGISYTNNWDTDPGHDNDAFLGEATETVESAESYTENTVTPRYHQPSVALIIISKQTLRQKIPFTVMVYPLFIVFHNIRR